MTRTPFASYLLCTCAAVAFFAPALADSEGGTETVIVTGTREEARSLKQAAPNVMDVQSLQEIRALPDVNAAEALQRVPGVSLESDSGEGRFINIRGMDADLNGTTYDGVRLMASNAATPQGGARAVAFDAFPSGILGGIEVTKSLTPDMDAEGLGGVVNIRPRTIPNGKGYFVDASLGTGLEPLRGTPVWQGDITAGTHFGEGDRMSVVGSFAFHDDQRGIDDIEEDYINDPTLPPKAFDDVQYRWYKYHRTRMGFGGSFSYAPEDGTELFIRGIHAGYTELGFKHRLQINGLADDIIATAPNGDITVDSAQPRIAVTNSGESIGNDMIELGGETVIADLLKSALRLSWTRGQDLFYRGDSFTFKGPSDITVTYNNKNPAFPSYSVLTPGVDFTNPNIYTSFSGANSPSKNFDQEYAGKLDFSVPLEFYDNGGELKFGGSVRERSRHASASLSNSFVNSLGYTSFADSINDIYYKDHYNLGPKPLYHALADLPLSGPFMDDPAGFGHDNENVFAGYVDYSATFDKLYVLVGLRVEHTQGTYRANSFDQNGNLLGLVTAKHGYTNYFPDVNLKYSLTDQFILRAAFSTAIARPGFNQITGARTINYDTLVVSQGNPGLKPTTGRNYDLSAEYYLPNGGIASIGLFYKEFTDYIIPTAQLNVTNYPDPILFGQNVEVDSFQNIGSSHAEGIELNYSQTFTFLPEPFDGLGFEGNLTAVGSSGQIRAGEKHTLPQTSPFNYNAAFFYEKAPVHLRIAASYVSRNLWSVSSDSSTDLYSQARWRLDFGGSYDICENVEWYFDAKNLANTLLEFTQTASKDFPVQREFYGPTFLTGVRIKLGD
jgi:TonB-dependent receptor